MFVNSLPPSLQAGWLIVKNSASQALAWTAQTGSTTLAWVGQKISPVTQKVHNVWTTTVYPTLNRPFQPTGKQKSQYAYLGDAGKFTGITTATVAATGLGVIALGAASSVLVISAGLAATIGAAHKIHMNVQQRKNERIWDRVNRIRELTVQKTTSSYRGFNVGLARDEVEELLRKIDKKQFKHIKEKNRFKGLTEAFFTSTRQFWNLPQNADYQAKKIAIDNGLRALIQTCQDANTKQLLIDLNARIYLLNSKPNGADFSQITSQLVQLNTYLKNNGPTLVGDIQSLQKMLENGPVTTHKSRKQTAIQDQVNLMLRLCPDRAIPAITKPPKPIPPAPPLVLPANNPPRIQPAVQPAQQPPIQPPQPQPIVPVVQTPITQPAQPAHTHTPTQQPTQPNLAINLRDTNQESDALQIKIEAMPANENSGSHPGLALHLKEIDDPALSSVQNPTGELSVHITEIDSLNPPQSQSNLAVQLKEVSSQEE